MEPRVAERRKSVSEERARRRLKRLLGVIAVLAVIFGTLWLIRSPLLSIRQVSVVGAEQSDPRAAIRSLGMDIGTPTIEVDRESIAAAVLTDPWVASVQVEVVWPGSIYVEVIERVPVAPVLSEDGWVLVARDGGVIELTEDPGAGGPAIAINQGEFAPGDTIVDPLILGAIAFIDTLTPPNRAVAILTSVENGLHAVVAGHSVRLGRPIDMEEKATVLEALLATGLDPGAAINLIAPRRPAVSNSGPEPEVEPEG
ncbi:MAG: FtsQ-type POTRA domain-containing protein [Actinomycetota bacterium]|nr:FtsQ-type POTRA domain-containing protein [Actinomycetota bacterium]MDK1016428.1 FtsQ-type POTRA domain-containing protein [Actinomycetota bacterium]MDK1026162.1 FtsQ-type POTRA domain-containing protein [Actinomycetota bacterium]MDK1038010.1 FtsQ-type POTRA domain-containing protein [Actinomycetota bacterium]MDK1096094.1 FtsQ-type POTRA domain-containing protein [Actinomycetota bacterium]